MSARNAETAFAAFITAIVIGAVIVFCCAAAHGADFVPTEVMVERDRWIIHVTPTNGVVGHLAGSVRIRYADWRLNQNYRCLGTPSDTEVIETRTIPADAVRAYAHGLVYDTDGNPFGSFGVVFERKTTNSVWRVDRDWHTRRVNRGGAVIVK